MLKKLAVLALFALGATTAVAKEHGWRGPASEYQQGQHDSRDFGHSRGRGRGQNWGYEEHDRRNFGHSRGRGRGRGLARNQQNYCNTNGYTDRWGNWLPDPNCGL